MARKGRGPKIDSMQKRYTIRVGDTENERISEYCEKTGESKSDLFRKAVDKYINYIKD